MIKLWKLKTYLIKINASLNINIMKNEF